MCANMNNCTNKYRRRINIIIMTKITMKSSACKLLPDSVIVVYILFITDPEGPMVRQF